MTRIEALERALAADPGDAFVLYALAQEHASAGRHAAAAGFYDRCIAVDPHSCYAYYHKARSLEAMGDEAGAISTLRAGLAASERAGDGKARGEIAAYLDMLEP